MSPGLAAGDFCCQGTCISCPRSLLVQSLGLRGASTNGAEVNHPIHDVIRHGCPPAALLSLPQGMAVDSCEGYQPYFCEFTKQYCELSKKRRWIRVASVPFSSVRMRESNSVALSELTKERLGENARESLSLWRFQGLQSFRSTQGHHRLPISLPMFDGMGTCHESREMGCCMANP